jgi:hypothetical protein
MHAARLDEAERAKRAPIHLRIAQTLPKIYQQIEEWR